MNDLELTVRLKADGSGLRGELRVSKEDIKKLKGELDDAGTEARQAADKLDKYGKEAEEAGKKSRKLKDETQGVGQALGSLRGLLGGLGLAAFTKDLIDTNKEFSLLRASLETVTGSSQAAEQAFNRISDFAASTPFDLQQVTEAFIKLKALGLDPSKEALTSYGNTASAMGKSLNQMIEAVADAATGEFERLKEFGIKARSEGDKVTFTFQGVSTTVKKEAAAIEGYLMSLGQVQFAGGMERQSKTLAGAISNLGDAWDKMLDKLLGGVLENALSHIVRAISWVLDMIGKVGDTVDYALRLMGFSAGDATIKTQALGEAAETTAQKLDKELAQSADKAGDKLGKLGDEARLSGEALIAVEFTKAAQDVARLERNLEGVAGTAKTLVEAFASGSMSQAEFNAALKATDERTREVKGELDKARTVYDHYLAILKRLSATHAAVNKQERERSTTLKQAAKAEQAHQKAVLGNMQALAQKYIELTQGARAAYEYSLRNQDLTESEIQAQLALYDTVKALEEKKAAEEKASKAAEQHASINTETSNEFQKVWENAISSVDNIFRDLWRGAFDSARDFGESIKEWFANLLAELAHQALTRPIVLSIGAMFSGGPGTSMAGQAGQSLLGGQGGFGSVFGKLGAFLGSDSIAMTLNRGMGLFNGGSGVGAGFAGPPSPGVTPMFGGTNLGYGLSGIAGAFIGNWVGKGKYAGMAGGLGGSLGYGLATGVGSGFMSSIGLGAIAGPVGMLVGALIGGLLTRAFGDEEAKTKFKIWGNAGAIDPANSKFAEGGKFDYRTAGALTEFFHKGARSRIQVDTAFGALGAGIQHTGNDGQVSDEDAQKYLDSMIQVFDGIRMMDETLAGIVGDDKLGQITDALANFGAELKSEKPEDVNKFLRQRYDIVFDTIGGEMDAIYDAMVRVSSGTDMTEIIGQVTAFFSTLEGYKSIVNDYDEMVRQAGLTQTEAMAEFTAGLYEQIAAYDGSIEDNRTITAGLQQRYQMELQYLAAIDAAQQSVTATLGKSIEAIRLSQMTDQQRYEYQKQQAEALAASLATMTDPAQITQTVNEINRLTMAAWNSLSDEQKAQVAGGFEEFLGSVDERANAQLDKAREEVQKEHDTLVQAYTDMAAAARELADAVGVDPVTPAEPGDQTDQNPVDVYDLFNSGAQTFDSAVAKFADLVNRFAGGADKIEKAASTPVEVRTLIELRDNGFAEVG